MPRVSRSSINSKYIHIIVQGLNKEKIFDSEEGTEKYLREIKDKKDEFQIKILAYCIMNNHAHFLIYTDNIENLSKYMQKVNIAYSKYYNLIKNRVGYVFRDRFYSQEIYNEKQLYLCLKYIHNNPVKAYIVNSMGEYKYSSYNEFLNESIIINKESGQLIFQSENYKEEFLKLHNSINDKNSEFVLKEIKEENFESFVENFLTKYNINQKDIKNNKEIREIFIKLARFESNVKLVDLAEYIGLSKSTIGKISKK